MRKIDLYSWDRREIYAFFSPLAQPWYSVGFRLDVGGLYRHVKTKGLPFYYAMCYLVTQAVNETEAFLYTIRGGEVYLLDRREPSFTVRRAGEKYFRIVTMPRRGSLADFCREAVEREKAQEAFIDSRAGEASDTVVGVGEELARILREEYGYDVLHHVETYDLPSRNGAYSKALPKVEKLLKEYPSIQVVIDLHRDEMPENVRLVTEIEGKKTARFMFFNGISRTKKTGELEYLHNEYLEDNLAFSLQMELAAREVSPDLTRKIYLKGYRYNMHVCPKTLLIELGAQNNTLEEAMNACGPLAEILDQVLSGKSREKHT